MQRAVILDEEDRGAVRFEHLDDAREQRAQQIGSDECSSAASDTRPSLRSVEAAASASARAIRSRCSSCCRSSSARLRRRNWPSCAPIAVSDLEQLRVSIGRTDANASSTPTTSPSTSTGNATPDFSPSAEATDARANVLWLISSSHSAVPEDATRPASMADDSAARSVRAMKPSNCRPGRAQVTGG